MFGSPRGRPDDVLTKAAFQTEMKAAVDDVHQAVEKLGKEILQGLHVDIREALDTVRADGGAFSLGAHLRHARAKEGENLPPCESSAQEAGCFKFGENDVQDVSHDLSSSSSAMATAWRPFERRHVKINRVAAPQKSWWDSEASEFQEQSGCRELALAGPSGAAVTEFTLKTDTASSCSRKGPKLTPGARHSHRFLPDKKARDDPTFADLADASVHQTLLGSPAAGPSAAKETRYKTLVARARLLVKKPAWEHMVFAVLVCNTVVLGVETDYQAATLYSGGDMPAIAHRCFMCVETFFCLLFVFEIAIRLLALTSREFFGKAWNVFDFTIVFIQVLEQASEAVPSLLNWQMNTSLLHALRVLRLMRIVRVLRMIRFVEELRTIVSSISSSLLSLAWTLLLLCGLLFMMSVFFTQVVVEAGVDIAQADEVRYWYGRLGRTYLTMFECIFSGVSWDEAIVPLMTGVSPYLGFIFVGYVAFCVLIMMNMATGVFVDNAIRKAQEDKDTNTANHISELFFLDHKDPSQPGTVTFEQFCSKINEPDMQEYFRAINVDPSEARGLYRLLDTDGSGSVDAEEMVSGCLRLRGNAKALELQLLMYEVSQVQEKLQTFQGRFDECLGWVCEVLEMAMFPKGSATAPPAPKSWSEVLRHRDKVSAGGADVTKEEGRPARRTSLLKMAEQDMAAFGAGAPQPSEGAAAAPVAMPRGARNMEAVRRASERNRLEEGASNKESTASGVDEVKPRKFFKGLARTRISDGQTRSIFYDESVEVSQT